MLYLFLAFCPFLAFRRRPLRNPGGWLAGSVGGCRGDGNQTPCSLSHASLSCLPVSVLLPPTRTSQQRYPIFSFLNLTCPVHSAHHNSPYYDHVPAGTYFQQCLRRERGLRSSKQNSNTLQTRALYVLYISVRYPMVGSLI